MVKTLNRPGVPVAALLSGMQTGPAAKMYPPVQQRRIYRSAHLAIVAFLCACQCGLVDFAL